jgi:hypothetical protein
MPLFLIFIEGCHGLGLMPELGCPVAAGYPSMPLIIALTTTTTVKTKAHKIAISDI